MDNLGTVIVIFFLLYLFGMLNKKNEKRVDIAIERLKNLFSDKHDPGRPADREDRNSE